MDFPTSIGRGSPDPGDPVAPLRGELAGIRLVGITLNLAEDVLVDRAATLIGCDEKPVDGEVELANTEHHLDVVGIQSGKCVRAYSTNRSASSYGLMRATVPRGT
ncbi:hypothetical protein GS462_27410 [Rhodococcus hoagii]|nr:hypothetical protein [Prescottella equi]